VFDPARVANRANCQLLSVTTDSSRNPPRGFETRRRTLHIYIGNRPPLRLSRFSRISPSKAVGTASIARDRWNHAAMPGA
jgi:hypothetical protein